MNVDQNIEIKTITIDQFNQFFKDDPALCYLGLSDQSLDYLYHNGTVIVPPDAIIYGVYIDNALSCCVQSDFWSDICTILHMYVPTTRQRKGVFRQVQELMQAYLKEHTNYRKALIYIPSACEHVIATAQAFGLRHEATITNCMTWRQKVVDLVIYGLELYEDKQ